MIDVCFFMMGDLEAEHFFAVWNGRVVVLSAKDGRFVAQLIEPDDDVRPDIIVGGES